MGNSAMTNNLSIDFRVLRKKSPHKLLIQGPRSRGSEGELHKISQKLIAYIRPNLEDSEISALGVSIFHIDRIKLLTSFHTAEGFVPSSRYNPFNKTVITCTPEQRLEVYSLRGKGSIMKSIRLPRSLALITPKIACINSDHVAILFPYEKNTTTAGFYILNIRDETCELTQYPNKPKCFISIESTNNSTIIIQGIKKGGDGFLSLYSFAMKSWLREFRCSPWATIKRIFPSITSNQIVVLKEGLFQSFLIGYEVTSRGTIIKLFEIEIHDFSSIIAIEHVTDHLLIARCTIEGIESMQLQKVILINTKRERYYSTNFQKGISCNINKNILCNLENNLLTVTKIPPSVHILDRMRKYYDFMDLKIPRNQGIADSIFS